MAARKRYPTPPEQMIELAEVARASGIEFEDWWREAVRPGLPPVDTSWTDAVRPDRCVIWPSDSQDCKTWRSATDGAKEGWRRAYERMPASLQEKSLTILAPALAALEARESVAA